MAHIHKPLQGGVRMSKVDWIKVLPSDVAFINQNFKEKQFLDGRHDKEKET